VISFALAQPPQVDLDADGMPLPERAANALVEIRVLKVLAEPALCELVFADPPGPLDAADALPPGAALRISLRGVAEPLFEGDVTASEHVYEPDRGRTVRIRGYDRMHRLRTRQEVRALVDVTAADVASQLAADVGLQVEAAGSGPTWSRLVQSRQTHLGLLIEVCEAAGLYPTVHGDVLHLVTLEGLADEPVRLDLGSTLFEAAFEANAGPALDRVTATGWDVTNAETVEGEAGSGRSGRAVAAEAPASTLGTSQRDLVDVAAPTTERATARAQAELDRQTAATVVFRGVAAGDPRLRPGAHVEVAGVDAAFAGTYVLSEADHTIDAERGYLCALSSAPPEPRTRPTEPSHVVPGEVIGVDDPDGLGRVQVTLPTLRDIESSWMEVLSVGAGSGKGLVALPDVGDRVLVLLVHGDPAQGIVLGGLYGTEGPFDSGVEGGAVKRFTLQTPGGQRVRLDDDGRTLRLEDQSGGSVELGDNLIRIEDATGNLLELTTDRVRLHSAVDLELEAPGRSVTIRGSSVDFETA
jgi:uncharacterized protein involved in type VI secretion and phage assembly